MLKAVMLDRQVVLALSLAIVVLGTYSINTRILDVFVALVFGGIGYGMLRYGYSTAAAALAVFLGGEFERNLRIGLNFHDNDFFAMISRPITAAILAVSIAIFAYGLYRQIGGSRRKRQGEDQSTVSPG